MKSTKTKKQIAILGVGAALCLATAASFGAMSIGKASAAELNQSSGKTDVEITYNVSDSWKVTIPETITMGVAAHIEATDVNIADGTLKVTVTGKGTGKWELTEDGGSKKIEYSVKKGTTEGEQNDVVSAGGSILEVASGTTSGEAYIKAEVEGNKSTGGKNYKDTLTFNASVTEAE